MPKNRARPFRVAVNWALASGDTWGSRVSQLHKSSVERCWEVEPAKRLLSYSFLVKETERPFGVGILSSDGTVLENGFLMAHDAFLIPFVSCPFRVK